MPDGFAPLDGAGPFVDLVGPLQVGPDGVLGVRLAFPDCSLRADGEEVVRARAVFAVRKD
jgi:hypothetical protein